MTIEERNLSKFDISLTNEEIAMMRAALWSQRSYTDDAEDEIIQGIEEKLNQAIKEG